MVPDNFEEDEIEDVRNEETNRGSRRKRVDSEERRKAARLRKAVIQAFKEGNEGILISALLDAEWDEDSPEFARALAVFRETVKRKR